MKKTVVLTRVDVLIGNICSTVNGLREEYDMQTLHGAVVDMHKILDDENHSREARLITGYIAGMVLGKTDNETLFYNEENDIVTFPTIIPAHTLRTCISTVEKDLADAVHVLNYSRIKLKQLTPA